MSDNCPQPTEYIRYHSTWAIFYVVMRFLLFAVGLYLLSIIFLGNTEYETGGALFLIAWTVIIGIGFTFTVKGVEASSDGLKLSYLLLKPKYIPWHDIHEVRLKSSGGQWCVIEYGENPVEKVSFIVDYMSRYARSERNRLLTVIVNRARLQRVGKNHWGSPVDEYDGPQP